MGLQIFIKEMYSTYSSDSAFEQMMKKKERASKSLFPQVIYALEKIYNKLYLGLHTHKDTSKGDDKIPQCTSK